MHGLIESMCGSSFGVAGIADGMTCKTEILYCTHVNQNHKYLGKEVDETRLSMAHTFLIQQKTVCISKPFPLFIHGPQGYSNPSLSPFIQQCRSWPYTWLSRIVVSTPFAEDSQLRS